MAKLVRLSDPAPAYCVLRPSVRRARVRRNQQSHRDPSVDLRRGGTAAKNNPHIQRRAAPVQLVGAQAWECSNNAKLRFVAAMRKDVCRQTSAYAPITAVLRDHAFVEDVHGRVVVVPELL
jgi:hypothetical protein